MAQWHNKGVVAAVHGHQIEVYNGGASVQVGQEGYVIEHTLSEMRELRDLYTEAVGHLQAGTPDAKPKPSVALVYKDGDAEPAVGTCVQDRYGDYWQRDRDGWVMWNRNELCWLGSEISWDYVTSCFSPLTVIDGDDPDMPWNQ